ncbi:hypothetical protein A3H03_03200 [Candidatus Kuenenbacteria bacterium RIFCSPLOWO2_12_FULL_42_13]|uniref:Polysaccharide pyruvyl transferase domain-containing protein n=4 Tax=Candidatus Kueneniibacteriota TaxID=1752740 RepID=A0A0G0Z480_9BACT|nr:MAG: hypothetical protein UV02_C0001G0012 [Candidatus Kuenenbacteria bacterium GW2011_GWA2_42_15]OGG89512.1 MAG: hypothetical protein A3C68_01575 [Candidatus Kuenenbacteria bacterium RIFCSPHIGHO2_02_FULL_42_29]OGG90863.1 MAG: hypothetical protein A3H55_00665 [Candidatus Kuenenbacteria bacterium RIFCSPLOWO2_02_FULL_42_16]OGG91563.1 MAG: hypothetical protein A3H03_03200 [Candidatus Kuenenbacteria bacterium RIFCSPLOWO2_12_FULL_42_13]OGG98659.1 MAG: hypothetical protein A3E04_03135 [Candidatus K
MKVLILADVGQGGNNWYHIGDEAMFLRNYNVIKKHYSNSQITLLSRSKSRQGLDIKEEINDLFPRGCVGRLILFISLCVQFLSYHTLHLFLKSKVGEMAKLINRHDLLLISGGGNLNSLFPAYLYNRTIILLLAKMLDKPVIATGQTIGPISNLRDSLLIKIILRHIDRFVLRDRKFSISTIPKSNQYRKRISFSVDDAYFLEYMSDLDISGVVTMGTFNIGISLRDWDSDDLYAKVLLALNHLAKNSGKKLKIYLIPHIFDKDNRCDLEKMRNIFVGKIDCEIVPITYQIISESPSGRPEEVVHALTGLMDIVISSRYHGIIFALSQNIPVVGVYENDYYRAKTEGAFDWINSDTIKKLSIDLNRFSGNGLSIVFLGALKNIDLLKKELVRSNKELLVHKDDIPNLLKALCFWSKK